MVIPAQDKLNQAGTRAEKGYRVIWKTQRPGGGITAKIQTIKQEGSSLSGATAWNGRKATKSHEHGSDIIDRKRIRELKDEKAAG